MFCLQRLPFTRKREIENILIIQLNNFLENDNFSITAKPFLLEQKLTSMTTQNTAKIRVVTIAIVTFCSKTKGK